MSWIRDAMILAGLVCLGVGLYFYDWRLAAIGIGGVLVVVGVGAAMLGAMRGQS